MRGFEDIIYYTNLKKSVNAAKIVASYYQSRVLSNPKITGMPISMSIEPTTACNLGCSQCPSGLKQFTRPTGNLKPETFNRVMKEVKDTLIYLTLYFQGEPFINPHFFDFVKTANHHKIFTSTSTNAHFLDKKSAEETVKSGLDKLIISVDGTTQESYEKYRINGDLEKVVEGIENLVEAKKRLRKKNPYIEVQFIVFKHNEQEIPQIKKMARSWGVDNLILKTAQIYDAEQADALIPDNPEYSRYVKNSLSPTLKINNSFFNHCWRMWHSCVMTWDGDIVPCCFDKDAKYIMGNLSSSSFKDIWFGEPYQMFREQLFKKRAEIDICKNCSEGTKVWI